MAKNCDNLPELPTLDNAQYAHFGEQSFQTPGNRSLRGRLRCTAKAKNHGGQCLYSAVIGKDKCRWHGGLTPVKHGRYSKYLGDTFRQQVVKESQEGRAKDLSDEMELLRVMAGRTVAALGKYAEQADSGNKAAKRAEMAVTPLVQDLLNDIRKMSSTMAKNEYMQSVTPAQMEFVIANVVSVLSTEVDRETLSRVVKRLGEMSWPDGVAVSYNPLIGRPKNDKTDLQAYPPSVKLSGNALRKQGIMQRNGNTQKKIDAAKRAQNGNGDGNGGDSGKV